MDWAWGWSGGPVAGPAAASASPLCALDDAAPPMQIDQTNAATETAGGGKQTTTGVCVGVCVCVSGIEERAGG